MAWHSQQNDRPPESAHAVAWASLFFSLLACGMAGVALLRGHDTGEMGRKIKENFKQVEDKASKLLKKGNGEKSAGGEKKTVSGAKEPTPTGTKGADEPLVDKEKIRQKVDELRNMVDKGDDRAGDFLESIKRDLGLLRDYTAEKGGPALQRTAEKLREVGEKLKEDSSGAAQKLKELSEDLAPKVKSMMGKDEEGKSEAAATPTPKGGSR